MKPTTTTTISKSLAALLMLSLIAGLAFGGFVYFGSERRLASVVPDTGFVALDRQDAEFVERGRHIARTRGCFGCHGQELEGQVFDDEWDWVERAVAPNLADYAKRHEAVTIEAAVRQGIGHDGRALWSMPSYNYALLTDDDVSALIAFLKSAPVVDKALPEPRLGWPARFRLFRGQAQHMAEWADAMPPLTLDAGDPLARGEYLAKTTCNECHGFDLRGQADIGLTVPDLAILAAYTDEEFLKLMAEGKARDGRNDLRLMTMIARDRFAYFTEQELDDLLAYLRTLPDQPVDYEAAWRRLR